MKKSIIFILISTVLVLTSCGKAETPTPNISDTAKQEKNIGENSPNPNLVEKENPKEEQKTENSENTVEKLHTTMLDIFKSWKTATCTFKITNEWTTFNGIMYIDWKKIRYTMNWDIEWQKMENNTVMKDGYTYTWSNMTKNGFKMKDDLSEDDNSWNEEIWEMEAEEMNQKVEFECKKWVDSSKFELPTDIIFQDMWDFPQMPMWN